MRHVCFRLGGDRPAPAAGVEPLQLGSRAAVAMAEALQVFACGEESAALAFQHLADTRAEAAASAALAHIAGEEAAHEALLLGLREALPPPARDPALRRALIGFYHGLAFEDPGRHLGSIAALDSAVCTIVAAMLARGRPLAREPRVHAVFARIRREEAAHVNISRRLASALAAPAALRDTAAQTRAGLVGVLALRGAAFEDLGVDPDWLFARLRHVPSRLFA